MARRRKKKVDQRTAREIYDEALKDPNYHVSSSPFPRMNINHDHPYKHPNPVVEILARRLYKLYGKHVIKTQPLPWKLLDPPTDHWRDSGHVGNGNIRYAWYHIAEDVLELLMCEDCADALHS